MLAGCWTELPAPWRVEAFGVEQRYEDLSCPENLLSPAWAISDMCAAKRESSRDRRTTWAVHCRLTGGRRQKPRRGKEKVIAAIAVGKRSNKSVLGSLFGVSQQFTESRSSESSTGLWNAAGEASYSGIISLESPLGGEVLVPQRQEPLHRSCVGIAAADIGKARLRVP